MASRAGAIRAGRAFVELFTEDSKFIRGLDAAEKRLQGFSSFVNGIGRKLMTAGASVLGAFGGAVAIFAKVGDELFDMSARTGVAVESLSRLQFAASQTGSEMSDVEAGIRVMQRSILDLSRDSASAVMNFGALGLTYSDLASLNPEQQFRVIAEAISKVSDPTMQAALAMKVFGRGGTALLPMLNQGAAGLDAMASEAERLGIVMSGEQAQAASDFADLWAKITAQLQMAVVQIGAGLAPEIQKLGENLTTTLRSLIDWIRENQRMIPQVAMVAVKVAALGAGLYVVGTAARAAAAAISILRVAVIATNAAVALFGAPIVAAGVVLTGLIGFALDAAGALDGLKSSFTSFLEWLGQKLGILDDTADKLDRVGQSATGAAGAMDEATGGNVQHDARGVAHNVGAPLGPERMPIRAFAAALRQQREQADEARRLANIRERERFMREDAPFLQPEGSPGFVGPSSGGAAGGSNDFARMRLGGELTAAPELKELLKAAKESLKGVGKVMEADPVRTLASEGTFSAAQAQLFGTGAESAQERTARASERTALNTEETARELRNGRAIVR